MSVSDFSEDSTSEILVRDRRKRGWYWSHNALFEPIVKDGETTTFAAILGTSSVSIYHYLARCADNDSQTCDPGKAAIMKHCGVSSGTAIEGKRRLVKHRLIHIVERETRRGDRDTDLIFLLDAEFWTATPAQSGDDEVVQNLNHLVKGVKNVRKGSPKFEPPRLNFGPPVGQNLDYPLQKSDGVVQKIDPLIRKQDLQQQDSLQDLATTLENLKILPSKNAANDVACVSTSIAVAEATEIPTDELWNEENEDAQIVFADLRLEGVSSNVANALIHQFGVENCKNVLDDPAQLQTLIGQLNSQAASNTSTPMETTLAVRVMPRLEVSDAARREILVENMSVLGVDKKVGGRLVDQYGPDFCQHYLDEAPKRGQKPEKWLVAAIKSDYDKLAQARPKNAEALFLMAEAKANTARLERERQEREKELAKAEQESAEDAQLDATFATLTPQIQAEIDAAARQESGILQEHLNTPGGLKMLEIHRRRVMREQLAQTGAATGTGSH